MQFQIDSWPSSFLESEYGFFLEDHMREHAEPLLNFSLAKLKEYNPHFPENTTASLWRALLCEDLPKLDLPLETKKGVPSLLEAFAQFLGLSGLYPPASDWETEIKESSQEYLTRFREDGSFRGETIKRDKKIPRNAPCPCGSGKKFKQCCGK